MKKAVKNAPRMVRLVPSTPYPGHSFKARTVPAPGALPGGGARDRTARCPRSDGAGPPPGGTRLGPVAPQGPCGVIEHDAAYTEQDVDGEVFLPVAPGTTVRPPLAVHDLPERACVVAR